MGRLILTLLVSLVPFHARALQPEDDAVFVRIIDTGAGHAAVVQMPGNHYIGSRGSHQPGANVNVQDGEGQTPIVLAQGALTDDPELLHTVAELLHSHGAIT